MGFFQGVGKKISKMGRTEKTFNLLSLAFFYAACKKSTLRAVKRTAHSMKEERMKREEKRREEKRREEKRREEKRREEKRREEKRREEKRI